MEMSHLCLLLVLFSFCGGARISAGELLSSDKNSLYFGAGVALARHIEASEGGTCLTAGPKYRKVTNRSTVYVLDRTPGHFSNNLEPWFPAGEVCDADYGIAGGAVRYPRIYSQVPRPFSNGSFNSNTKRQVLTHTVSKLRAFTAMVSSCGGDVSL